MRRRIALLVMGIVLVGIVAMAPAITANHNGVGSADREYDCGGSCHSKDSSAVLTMTASSAVLSPGQSVTITVTVSGGQASDILGVMLVSSLSPVPESEPTASGWTITSDPSGSSKFNYYEIDDYAGSRTFVWTMAAPSAQGNYTLYARVMHGGGGQAYARDHVGGVSFVVGVSGTPQAPVVLITSPVEGSTVAGEITVSANIPSSQAIAYAILRIDGVEKANRTAAPFSWTFSTQDYSDGEHTINITAVDTTGKTGYKQIVINVDNAAANELMLNWVWTMAAGSLAIFAFVGLLIVVALLIRRKIMGGKL